jgi:16S rRNA (cytidine1402-2'-O)-methyltransferase
MTTTGTLYLIPTVIATGTAADVIPGRVTNVLKNLQFFLAEDIRSARRYLSSLNVTATIESLHFAILNKDTRENELEKLMNPVMTGHDVGVISESGCPGIADPGALAVDFAHRKNIRVVPLAGPSSILLALMASGLNGQQFAFHGYIPIEAGKAARAIRDFEQESKTKNQTQIFIETPYRTNTLFQTFINRLHPGTRLCVALDLTSPNEKIRSMAVREWKTLAISFPKSPAIFLFLA